jgi:transposase
MQPLTFSPATEARKRCSPRFLEDKMRTIPCRRYTGDFKHQAMALAQPVGKVEAAGHLDMPIKTWGDWIAAVRTGRPLRSPCWTAISGQESELACLRVENATLKMEREILKKRNYVLN